jgi:UDP-N-acetylmuramyl tripeptide synthase
MSKKENPRKKKLDAISTKIAKFMMQETYTDEEEAHKLLSQAIGLLDQAADLLVKSDEAQPA